MRESKFRYVFKNSAGEVLMMHFTMMQIEEANGGFVDQIKKQIGDEWNLSERSQYIGLKDRRGIDVYEGDIICSYNESNEPMSKLSAIEYDEGLTKFTGFNVECGDYEEIVGNIYENPELINH